MTAWRPAPGPAAQASAPGGTAWRPAPPPGAPGATAWRPALARGVVLRHDPVRDTDLLLLPERVVVLHGHAGAVLGLCDGSRSVDRIVAELSAGFPGAPVAVEVPDFLARLRKEGWLT
ncbi:pyrroloquinoline quinone biosynthesis peptide chaperone PqqD [Streptomyces sp. NPDC101151]|uniref:pyrroloquinoline quinone biosynthesis peptide chaperone PqqD n=1 Tax=Streptomyces sp. NPDC101151 TaxID=3366115 RepID=UPI003801B807